MTPGLYPSCWNLSLVELSHGFGSFGDGVLRKLTRKHQANSRLNASAAHGLSLAHLTKLRSLHCNLVKHISDEVVDDCNALLRDAGLWMNLLQDFSDVRFERLRGTTLAHRGWLRGLHNLLHHCAKRALTHTQALFSAVDLVWINTTKTNILALRNTIFFYTK